MSKTFKNRFISAVVLSIGSLCSLLFITGTFSLQCVGTNYWDRALTITIHVTPKDDKIPDKEQKSKLANLSPKIDIIAKDNLSILVKINLEDSDSEKGVTSNRYFLKNFKTTITFNREADEFHWRRNAFKEKLIPEIHKKANNYKSYAYSLSSPPKTSFINYGVFTFNNIVQKSSYADRSLEFTVSTNNDSKLFVIVTLPNSTIPSHMFPPPTSMEATISPKLHYDAINELGYKVQRRVFIERKCSGHIIYNQPIDTKMESFLMILFSSLMGIGFAIAVESIINKKNV